MQQFRHYLTADIKNCIQVLSQDVLEANRSISSTIYEMNQLSRKTLQTVGIYFSQQLNVETTRLPFALFLFGSCSRNLMLPNSDLDVAVVCEPDCSEKVKTELISLLLALPFDKIDMPKWQTIENMTKNASVDMIEYSKAVDALYVSGSQKIKDAFITSVRNLDTQEDKIARFITAYDLLRRYSYISKISDWGFNLKYDFGGSRDLIFFDWYFLIHKDYNEAGSVAFTNKGQDLLLESKVIDVETYKSLIEAMEIVLLVKFVLLYNFRVSGNESMLSLSGYSLQTAFEYAPQAFKRLNITGVNELITSYFAAKSIIHSMVETMYQEIAQLQPDVVHRWENSKKAISLDLQEQTNLNMWQQLVPYAINSTQPYVLDQIVETIKDIKGFEYILRILSQNQYINKNIAQKLIQSRLADEFKIKLKNKYVLETNDP